MLWNRSLEPIPSLDLGCGIHFNDQFQGLILDQVSVCLNILNPSPDQVCEIGLKCFLKSEKENE